MAKLNSELDKYISSLGLSVSPQDPYENCASTDAIHTSNSDTTNAQDNCIRDTSNDHASNSSETKSDVEAQALRQSPVSGSLDDLPFASTNDRFDEPETDDCISNCAPTDDISNEPNDADSPPTRRYFTDKKFDAYDFRDALRVMHKEMTQLQEKGGYAYELIQEFKDLMLEYKDDLDIETYYMVTDVLHKFINVHNSAESVNRTIKKMTFVMDHNKLLEETFFGLKKIDTRQDDIQKRIVEIKSIDISDIFEYTKTVQEAYFDKCSRDLFNELLLPRLKKFAKEVEELVSAIHEQTQSINEVLHDVDRKTRMSNNDSDDEITIGIVVRYRNKVSPKAANQREKQLNKEDEQSKIKICRLEHNIPFCSNCGWRSSWLKAFKKRGVFVKEDANGTNKDIWFNDMNKR